MTLAIRSLATARPTFSIEQEEAARVAASYGQADPQERRLVPILYRRTRVRTRGSVLLESDGNGGVRQSFFPPAVDRSDRGPGTAARMQRYAAEAGPLALDAARAALEQAGSDPSEITQQVTVSCTGFLAPGIDLALIERLGLSRVAGRTHVGFMGCHGALNGLRVADGLLGADPAGQVLLTALELCSLHYQYGWDPDRVVANALFADGAAAIVAARQPRDGDEWQLLASGSCVFPDSADTMTWRIGDHGFEMSLSPRVPDLILTHLKPWLSTWLAQRGYRIEAIGSWAIHPGGPRIVDSAAESLGLPDEAVAVSRAILAEHGNMSSPTILFILQRLQQLAAPLPCVALAFGPGLAAEVALFD